MLEELAYESKGNITGRRVLSVEIGIPILEISVTGSGIMRGKIEVTETWTYWNRRSSHDFIYGEGLRLIKSNDSDVLATATGHGIGKSNDSGKTRWYGAIFFTTTSKDKLVFLNNLVGVNEDEVDPLDNYVQKVWKWK